jgi:hypothetical protein
MPYYPLDYLTVIHVFLGSTLKKTKPQLLDLYRRKFPNLPVEVVERFTKAFNCIAFTIGVRDRWVWNEIDTNQDGFASYTEFIAFYRRHGFEITPLEAEADIAIFGKMNRSRVEVKHGARREPGTGYWLSKMGQGGIIRHKSLNVFKDSPYGDPLLMFRRIS